MPENNTSGTKAVQLGFIYDSTRCVRCRTCETACKATRAVEPGLRWRWTGETWQGTFPEVTRTFLSASCMHCAEPACISVCPTDAISKTVDGVVRVDAEKCNGCRECLSACPYDVPQFGHDGIMQKCDYCRGPDTAPVCAAHCPTGALRYGDVSDHTAPDGKTAERYPGPTGPSLVILRYETGYGT